MRILIRGTGFLIRNDPKSYIATTDRFLMDKDCLYNELIAIVESLQLVVDEDMRLLEIESDSIELLKLHSKILALPWRVINVLRNIKSLLDSFHEVKIFHIY